VRIVVLAVVGAVAGYAASIANAGYPVQPTDGRAFESLTPTFLVYYEPTEVSQYVYISTSPTPGYGGSLLFSAGYLGSCRPTTPFGEPNKYTCAAKFEREGSYYWQFKYEKYECETLFGYPSCAYETYLGPIWRFDLRLPAAPTTTALPTFRGPSTRSRRDALYSKIATEIARKRANVYCWSAADWNRLHVRRREERGEGLAWVLGYVPYGSTAIHLAPEVCNRLDLIAYKKKRPQGTSRVDFAEAVDTLAHEAIHALGVTDEAITECYSLQLMDWTAMKLGTNYSYAREMSRSAWRVIYPLIPDEYWSPDCYSGGPLDLFPDTSIWP